jgi:RNA polymerase sigma-70 factor (ECF subfamily)
MDPPERALIAKRVIPNMDDGLEHNPLVSRSALAAEHRAAYAWALSLTGYDDAAAADVMQQSYLLIVEGRARFANRSSLGTWLFGVVRNCARRLQRRNRRDLALVARFAAEPRDGETNGADLDTALSAALATLPRRQRDVLELVAYADFTLEQVAEVLGISVGSTRTHYHRAKLALRARLEAP